jgi:hypothetical protein
MKLRFFLIVIMAASLAALGVFVYKAQGQAKAATPPQEKPVQLPTGNQVLMRDKLKYANKALEGLSLEDFDKIAESAEFMRMISKAASWHVLDSEEYARYSKNFQEEASDLKRHAQQKNLEAASLDYMRITMTCVQCHKHMREKRQKP